MLVEAKCPNCGAVMQVDDTLDSLTCPYCGTQIVNLSERVIHDYEGKPNLYVEFADGYLGSSAVVTIDGGNNSFTAIRGKATSVTLEKGVHLAKIRFGKKSYLRTFVIRKDNAPVKFILSDDNSQNHIYIEQPALSEEEQEAKDQRLEQEKQSRLGIIAFVFSCTMFLSFIGVILGIIDLQKREPVRKHTFAKIAIIVGGVLTLAMINELIHGKDGEAEESVGWLLKTWLM